MNGNLPDFPPEFWAYTAGLTLLSLIFVLVPLLRTRSPASLKQRRQVNIDIYRDQLRDLEAEHAQGNLDHAQFEAAKLELENRLVEEALTDEDQPVFNNPSKWLGIALSLALPLLAFGIYFLLGNPWAIEQASQLPMPAGQHGDLSVMLEKIRRHTEENPNDAKAWLMRAKLHSILEDWLEADKAYARVIALQPQNATAIAGHAESLAILNGRIMQGKPMELVLQALAINPKEPKALELAGIGAFQDNNFAQAAYYWKQLLEQLPPDSPSAPNIVLAIKEAEERAKKAKLLDKKVPEVNTQAVQTIQGIVEVSPRLKDKIPANATLFLFAKPIGGRMPIAVIRTKLFSLPFKFELNDSMTLTPEVRLSSFREVTLTARLSMSGEAMAQSGDLEGTLTPVKVGAKDIRLVIDTVRP